METIGVFSQKGGQGKSFITTLLAQFLLGYGKVLIVDMDYPQNTILKTREEELNFLKNNKESAFYKKVALLNKEDTYDIIKCMPENLIQELEKQKKVYEYCFVDFTGSLNVVGLKKNIFTHFKHIIVPTRVDIDDLRSNLEFCYDFLERFSKTYDFKYSVVFNLVENNIGDKKRLDAVMEYLKKHNMHFFKTYILKRKKYSKFKKDYADGEKSTLLKITDDSCILDLRAEFIKYIKS